MNKDIKYIYFHSQIDLQLENGLENVDLRWNHK